MISPFRNQSLPNWWFVLVSRIFILRQISLRGISEEAAAMWNSQLQPSCWTVFQSTSHRFDVVPSCRSKDPRVWLLERPHKFDACEDQRLDWPSLLLEQSFWRLEDGKNCLVEAYVPKDTKNLPSKKWMPWWIGYYSYFGYYSHINHLSFLPGGSPDASVLVLAWTVIYESKQSFVSEDFWSELASWLV